MKKTIVTTKYYAPTDTKGHRVKVETKWGSKLVGYDRSSHFGVGVTGDTIAEVVALIANKRDPLALTQVASAERVGSGPDVNRSYWAVHFEVFFKN